MRKSRSSHIKCDCGEKTSKCAHLQPTVEGHTGRSSWAPLRPPELLGRSQTAIQRDISLTRPETCCCNHGGRCSCSAKKETQQPTLDTVPESDSDGELPLKAASVPARNKAAIRRRRANTIHSGDSALSLDHGHGHHKATTGKHNRASQKVGPYQLNRVNSANSTSSLGAGSDSMAELRGNSQRRVKSEATSPLMSASTSSSGFHPSASNAASVPPLDLSNIDYPSYAPSAAGNNGPSSFDLFGAGFSPDTEAPLYSAGLSNASVDWSHYDFPGDSFGPSSYSQTGAQSFANLTDFGSNSDHLPTLVNTTSNSGDVSEVEDIMPGADDFTGSFMRQNVGMLGAGGADLSAIDYDSFYKGSSAAADPNPMGMSMVEDDPAFWMPNYNDGIVGESPDALEQPAQATFWEV